MLVKLGILPRLVLILSAFVALGAATAFTVAGATTSRPGAARIEADASQAQALADGVITAEEYDEAVSKTVSCMEASGLRVVVSGVLKTLSSDGPITDAQLKAARECSARFSEDLTGPWQKQLLPTDEVRAGVRAETTECFVAGGGIIESGLLTYEDLSRILTEGSEDQAVALGNCLQANIERLGYAF